MLSSLRNQIIELLFVLPCVILALSVHEVAHGWMAYKLGDPTAKNMGRLTLNPLKHLDPLGTLCMIFFHFGWARPVPINTRYFKNNKRDTALTALAGPLSNFIMAFIGILLYRIFVAIFIHFPTSSSFVYNLQEKMKDICQKFATKVETNLDSLIFLYAGTQLNLDLGLKAKSCIIRFEFKQF